MIYIGIDPGKDGAMALIYSDGDIHVHTFEVESYRFYLEEIYESKLQFQTRCCLEQVHAMPKQGTASTFAFGENFGLTQGMLTAFSIPFQIVPPRKWKGEFGLNSDKQRSIDVCKRLFPGVSLRRTDRCKTDHDGMAEALLMAEYARRRL